METTKEIPNYSVQDSVRHLLASFFEIQEELGLDDEGFAQLLVDPVGVPTIEKWKYQEGLPSRANQCQIEGLVAYYAALSDKHKIVNYRKIITFRRRMQDQQKRTREAKAKLFRKFEPMKNANSNNAFSAICNEREYSDAIQEIGKHIINRFDLLDVSAFDEKCVNVNDSQEIQRYKDELFQKYQSTVNHNSRKLVHLHYDIGSLHEEVGNSYNKLSTLENQLKEGAKLLTHQMTFNTNLVQMLVDYFEKNEKKEVTIIDSKKSKSFFSWFKS